MSGPPVNNDELFRSIVDEVSGIGREPDGATTRLAYSAEERAAHDAIRARFSEPPFLTRIDAAGNLIVTLPGIDPELPYVLTGSHLDSVPHGGMWDGALGVYSAAAALVEIAASGTSLRRSIVLVAFASEESPRFAQSAYRFGSRAMAGIADVADTERLRDIDGISLADAMRRLGLDPTALGDAHIPSDRIHTILELHIDQGLSLVDVEAPVSAVSAITGSCRLRVSVLGQADHSGAARMSARRDALAGAAEMVLLAEAIGRSDATSNLVTTVGTIRVEPSSVSVVPGLAEFSLDIRSVDQQTMDDAQAAFRSGAGTIAAQRSLELSIDLIRDVPPISMSADVIASTRSVLEAHGLAPVVAPSHAGHDTGSFAGHPRLGMIFVRNPSGRSHSRHEQIEWGDAVIGKDVLRDTLVSLANQN